MSTMAAKPSVVIIPGSYCPALFYNDLKHLLRRADYDVHLHDLLTTSRAPGLAPASLTDDGEYFHNIISKLVDSGRDVVVIAHSYGGMVLREAIHNLSKLHHPQGGVMKVIYISPILVPEGETAMEQITRHAAILTFPTAGFTEPVDPDGQYLRQNPLKAWEFFFGDLGREDGVKWTAHMTMHTMLAWTTATTKLSEEDRNIPVTFVKCLKDVVFPLTFQDEMVKMLQAEGSTVEVREIDSAHCPNASCPEKLAELLIDVMEGRT